MADDYGAINGEQINYYAINDGNVAVEVEASHNFSFNQTIQLHRGRGLVTAEQIWFDQAIELRTSGGMVIADITEFVDDIELDQLYPIVIRHTVALGMSAEVDHAVFARWRSRGGRLIVADDFRAMRLAGESRRIEVLPGKALPPRDMRHAPDNRRIIVPPEPGVSVRQKHGVIHA